MKQMIDYADAIERFSEWFRLNKRNEIKNKEDFDIAYAKEKGMLNKSEKEFREKVKANYFQNELFKQAGGKDLVRDRLTTSKQVVTNQRQYIQKGASRTYLKGFDTKKGKDITRNIDTPARVKKKVVFAEKTSIIRQNKTFIIYRDSKGRFASVKR